MKQFICVNTAYTSISLNVMKQLPQFSVNISYLNVFLYRSISPHKTFHSSQHNANSYKHGDRDNVPGSAVTQISSTGAHFIVTLTCAVIAA